MNSNYIPDIYSLPLNVNYSQHILKQTERLKCIYEQLQELPQTIASLQQYFSNIGVDVSNRQLYRDLKDVQVLLLRPGEHLEQRTQEYNRKVWVLQTQKGAETVVNYDIDTHLISRATVPLGISIGRKNSLQKIYRLLNNNVANSKFEQNGNWSGESLESTHFYEVPFGVDYQTYLDQILWAATNHRSIIIEAYSGDSVSLNKSVAFPFTYNPIKVIYHRGSFFVAGVMPGLKGALVLDINQISKFSLSNNTFLFKGQKALVNEELQKRFGITQNIDEHTYEILLEFSPVTGHFVKNHLWHHSQVFETMKNGNYLLRLQCGINRELVGWIFQWMGNVKIIAPAILAGYYQEQLYRMLKNQQGEDLSYTNIFQPV